MSAPCPDPDGIEEAVAIEVKRLTEAQSTFARQQATQWWVRRFERTAAFPGSRQHAIAVGVLATVKPAALKAYRRAEAIRRGRAS